MPSAAESWFGEHFADLHPLLQKLHKTGGTLSGRIRIEPVGWIGRRLARRFGIPIDRTDCGFRVEIRHEDGILHWRRRFETGSEMVSLFQPVGTWPDGYWLETTGPLRLALTVDIRDGGWYWRPLRAIFGVLPIPMGLLPRTEAYKRIEEGRYRFSVGFTVPLLGPVLRYGGLLDLTTASRTDSES